MDRVEIGRWVVEQDREATLRAFAQLPLGSGCSCSDCRNFLATVDGLVPAFHTLTADLGIDARKPSELTAWCREETGLHLIGGFYHFVGRIVSGDDVLQMKKGWGHFQFEQLAPCFEFGLSHHLQLVRSAFGSNPLVQLEFQTRVPWVLGEPEPV